MSSKVIKEREPYNSRVYNVIKRFQSQWPKVEDPNMKDAKDDASVSPRNRIPQHDNQTESNSKVNKYNSDEEDAISNKWKPELAWLTKALEPTLQLCRWPLPTGPFTNFLCFLTPCLFSIKFCLHLQYRNDFYSIE